MDGWMERCVYFYMIVWMDEWTVGTTDGRTDRWMGGKEEGKKESVEEGMYVRNEGYFVAQFQNG